jgi:long-subunit fatty acid transport protein
MLGFPTRLVLQKICLLSRVVVLRCTTGLGFVAITSTAMAGAPYLTDDPDTPDKGHFEINLSLQYSRFQGGSSGAAPAFEVNYGVTDKLQLSAMVPLAFNQADGIGTNAGIGDTEIGVKYRFVDSDDWGWRPGVAFAPTLITSSGSSARGLGAGYTQAFLPVWVSKELKQWTVFGGGGLDINPGPNGRNWWFTGVGLTRELSPKWTVGMEVFDTTPSESDGRNSVGFNVGATYNISDTHHILFSIGRNITNVSANQVSTYIGYQLTF